MARYTGLPDVPQGVDQWQAQILDGLKQNVELLAGIRGEADRASQAITKGDVAPLGVVPEPDITGLSAKGAGFTISGQNVVSLDDYAKLLTDVQRLIQDVAQLNRYVNILVAQLKR